MKIYLYKEPAKNSTTIYFYNELPNGKIEVYNFNKANYNDEIISPGQSFPETFGLELPNDAMVDLVKTLVEHLDKQGIRSETEQKLAGKLEATSYHLEDLRTLLKLNDHGQPKLETEQTV